MPQPSASSRWPASPRSSASSCCIYLKHAWEARLASGRPATLELLDEAIREGAVLRVRPKAMTVSVIIAGLLPIMWSHGTGSEVMQRIAAPMIGGMITAPLLSLFVIPGRLSHSATPGARRGISIYVRCSCRTALTM